MKNKLYKTLSIVVGLIVVSSTNISVDHKVDTKKYLQETKEKQIIEPLKESKDVEKVINISKEDIKYLAYNIYFEARGENLHGKLAVAFVTMNRVGDKRWPDSIKEVVTQPWQFSWYNSGTIPPVEEIMAWEDSKTIAKLAIDLYNTMTEADDFTEDGIVKGATHYFNASIVVPSWAKRMEYKTTIASHTFYKE